MGRGTRRWGEGREAAGSWTQWSGIGLPHRGALHGQRGLSDNNVHCLYFSLGKEKKKMGKSRTSASGLMAEHHKAPFHPLPLANRTNRGRCVLLRKLRGVKGRERTS